MTAPSVPTPAFGFVRSFSLGIPSIQTSTVVFIFLFNDSLHYRFRHASLFFYVLSEHVSQRG